MENADRASAEGCSQVQPGMAQSFVACLQACTLNEFSVPLGHWKVSWSLGILGASHRKVVVSLLVVIFRHPERETEGLRSVSHLGEGFLEGVEKKKGGRGRREGTVLIPSVQHF